MLKIEYFYYVMEIAKSKTINKAAENLYISQPYLSLELKELEAQLKVSLFKRSNRGVTLTPEGELFLEYAKEMLELINKANAIHKIDFHANDSLAISSMYSFTMLDVFHDFSNMDTHQDYKISYEEIPNSFIPQKVQTGKSDIGIVFTSSRKLEHYTKELADIGLAFHPIITEPVYAVLNKDNPLASQDFVTLKDLEDYKYTVEKTKQAGKSASIENNLLPEILPYFHVKDVSFDNNRSLLYYLTKNSDCFTLGQKGLNLTNPFCLYGNLVYVPISGLDVEMVTGYVVNTKIASSKLLEEFIHHLQQFVITNSI